ncbi:hypothetical protein Y032_0025g1233 [Ancylostoma ceylanicum]|uniref:RNA-directed DNA polymerase n=1 Tax=Ancylostoma ceylanicum TaxID=53326 RepID=A0A016UUU2_9BILA|nr:hypothetical protein Y032_0025g1233 [Ancylostoma ceylanicum]
MSRGSSRQSPPESFHDSMIGESISVISGSASRTGRNKSGNPVDDMFSIFKEVFKAQTVANVPKYNGKNSFTDFLRALDVKFPSAVWKDSDRRDILVNHLEGTAKAVFNSLPHHIQNGTFYAVVDALKTARRNPCERLKNIREWDQLSKRNGESVVEFCCRMEEISRRIHPSSEWDFIRGSKLYSCLEHWQNSYHMLAALNAPEGEVYEAVKRVARRLEKLHEDVPRHAADYTRGKPEKPYNRMISPEIEGNSSTQGNHVRGPLWNKAPFRCFNCGEAGHAAPQCPKKDGNRPTHRFQNKPPWNGRNSNANPVPSNAVGGITLADEIDGWCRAAQEGENHRDLLPRAVGQPCVCNVKIFGVTTKALIDTGSVISIVPVGLLKMARQQGVNFDAEAAKVGSGNERTLIDASGNPMSFLAELVANVRVQEAGKAPVHLYVQRTQDTTLLLGTNALSELGITIIFSTSASDADGLGASPVSDNIVKAANRIIVPPGCVATVKVEGPGHGSCLFWSQTERIESGVCLVKQNQADIPIVNRGSEPWVIQKGEQLGEWSTDSWVDPKVADIPGDMLSLNQPIMADADRVASLITILDLNRKAGPMPDEIRRVVGEYHDVFAISDLELTQTNLVDHDIDVGGHPPIKQKTRPVPYGIRAEVESMLIDLKDRKVIEDSQSSWASPIVLVAKKDGTIRLCVDYREVNKVTKKDSYPLPPIDIRLQNLQGKRWFTSLDLASGYWQVPLTARAKEIGAFTTTSGQFQFRVLPFGLTTAPTKFQRLMEHVLGDLKGPEVSVYIDDILIATDSAERHVQVLKRVLEAFRKAQLKVKPQKCRLLEPSIEFLGHLVDKDGIKTDPEKVVRIQNYSRPANLAQLRTFLGMAGYYRKFVLRFAQISKPLYELTSPKNRFLWSTEHEHAFETLKKVLCEAPVLAQPNIEKARDGSRPFVIYTDASRIGLGAVLAQEGEDRLMHPVFFASKSLTQAERNYHVTDQEALAIVYALKKFHYFIYGVHTIVMTDHSALTSLFKRTNVSPRVLRWALEVQRYNLTIEHVKGAANCVADALSRGLPQSISAAHGYAEDEKVVCAVQEDDWLAELRQDPNFSNLISAIENEEVKLPRHDKTLSSADFIIKGSKLKLLREDGSPVPVVPQSHRRDLFDESHSGVLGGHFHARKMFRTLKKVVFWPGMYQDLVSWCKSCHQCFLTNRNTENIPPLRPIEVCRPFQIVGVDLLEMGLTTSGNRYIVTVIDHFTKYLGAYPVANKRAETVAEAIFSNWICGAGRWPEILLSDRGSEFENEIMAVLCQFMGIDQKFTKGYCPRENGLTERVNGTIVRMLKKKTVVPAEWDKILPTVVYAYNASEHRATGESPHFLVYGRDPKYPSGVIPTEQLSPYIVDYDNYKTELLCGLNLAQELISESSKEYRDKMKENYDRKWKTNRSTIFKTGDRVYMKLPAEKSKARHPKLVTE